MSDHNTDPNRNNARVSDPVEPARNTYVNQTSTATGPNWLLWLLAALAALLLVWFLFLRGGDDAVEAVDTAPTTTETAPATTTTAPATTDGAAVTVEPTAPAADATAPATPAPASN